MKDNIDYLKNEIKNLTQQLGKTDDPFTIKLLKKALKDARRDLKKAEE